MLLISCQQGIEKRRYTKGFYLSQGATNKKAKKENSESQLKSEASLKTLWPQNTLAISNIKPKQATAYIAQAPAENKNPESKPGFMHRKARHEKSRSVFTHNKSNEHGVQAQTKQAPAADPSDNSAEKARLMSFIIILGLVCTPFALGVIFFALALFASTGLTLSGNFDLGNMAFALALVGLVVCVNVTAFLLARLFRLVKKHKAL